MLTSTSRFMIQCDVTLRKLKVGIFICQVEAATNGNVVSQQPYQF